MTINSKEAAQGVTVYLMEELTDARLRCEQLKRHIQDALKLIEQSPQRDHFFEVAGHLIHGIPETLFKLDKALSATALAATRLDYDEIAQTLRPEKVEELERALDDSRIRSVSRRSGDQMTPNDTAKSLQAMASEFESTGCFPVREAAELVATLREEAPPDIRLASIPAKLAPGMLDAMANMVASGTLRNRARLAAMLDAAVTQAIGGQKMQALLETATGREDVIDGFKENTPSLTDDQLEEIADQWEKNKDVVKDKTAAAKRTLPKSVILKLIPLADTIRRERKGSYPQPPKSAAEVLEIIEKAGGKLTAELYRSIARDDTNVTVDVVAGTNAFNLFFTKDSFFKALAKVGLMYGDDGIAKLDAAKTAGAGEEFQKVNPKITDEQVEVINKMHDEHKDVVKNLHQAGNATESLRELCAALDTDSRALEARTASFWQVWRQCEASQSQAFKQEVRRIVPTVIDLQSGMRRAVKAMTQTIAVEDQISKFEKGKPADPTENMTPEQKTEWDKQKDEHKDEFKTASFPDWPTPEGVSDEEWRNALMVYADVTEFLKPAWNAGTENPDRREVPKMDVNILVDWLDDVREQGHPAAEYVAQTIRIETLLKSLTVQLDKAYATRRDDILQYINLRGFVGKEAYQDLLFGQDTYADTLRHMRHDGLIALDPSVQGYVRV